ncbi:MAG: FtsX-like permease family protein [Oscillospiraceae bacterium]|nr:FtsX-like permease family protein [Oscillospiraceae bacterium]
MLFLKALRDMKKSIFATVTIVVIITLGVAMWTGFDAITKNMDRIVGDFYSEHNMPHLFVSGMNLTQRDIREFSRLDGVRYIDGRNFLEFYVPALDDALLRVTAIDINSNVNIPLINSGNLIRSGDARQIMLNQQFLEANDLSIGDEIRLRRGDEFFTYIIAAGMQTPDRIFDVMDATSFLPDHSLFGYAILDSSAIVDMLYGGQRYIYNQIFIVLEDTCYLDFVRDEIRSSLGTRLASVQSRSEHLSAQMVDQQVESMSGMIGLFPLMFFTIAAMIAFTSLKRLVEKERTIIGTMKAIGIGKYKIIFHYTSYGIIYSVLGAAFGVLLSNIIPSLLFTVMDDFFNLPPYELLYDTNMVIIAASTAVAVGTLSAFLACKSTLKLSPAVCMRPKASKPGKRILLERVTFVWNRIGFIQKVVIRNMLRNKDRFIMSTFGIMCSAALLFMAFAMSSSIDHLMDSAFDATNRFDVQIHLNPGTSSGQANRMEILPYFYETELLMEQSVRATGNSADERTVTLTVVPDDLSLMVLYDEQLTTEPLPRYGVIVSEILAEQLGVDVGDWINIAFTGRRDTVDMQVEKLIFSSFGQGVYATQTAWRAAGQGFVATSVIASLFPGVENEWLSNRLDDRYDFVSNVVFQSDLRAMMDDSIESSYVSIYILMLLSGLLAFIVLFNLGTLNFYEREREIATLKVLGFYKREINVLAFAENYLFCIVGIVLGLIFGRIGSGFLVAESQSDALAFELYTNFANYIYPVIGVFLFAWLTNKFLGRYVKKLNMIEVLK